MASSSQLANIKIDPSTRDRVKSLKRGGDTYDDVLQKMADQYNPDAAHEGND